MPSCWVVPHARARHQAPRAFPARSAKRRVLSRRLCLVACWELTQRTCCLPQQSSPPRVHQHEGSH
eukprot:3748153-Prymnesium_polylepis.1